MGDAQNSQCECDTQLLDDYSNQFHSQSIFYGTCVCCANCNILSKRQEELHEFNGNCVAVGH